MDTTNLLKDPQGMIQTGAGSYVNPKFMSQQGLLDAQKYAGIAPNTPTTINPATLGSITPLNMPSTTPSTNTDAAGIIGTSTSNVEQLKAEIATMDKQAITDAKSTAESNKASLWESITGKKQILTDQAAAMQDPEFLAKQEAKKQALNTKENLLVAQVAETKALDGTNITLEQKAIRTAEINNKYALQHTLANVNYDIANRDYQGALDNINTAAKLKMDALQPEIDYYTAFLASNEANLTKAQQAQIQSKKDELTLAQTQAGDFEKSKGTMMIQAKENGAGDTTIQAMSRATDISSLVQAAGQFAGDVLDRQIKQANLANIYSQIAERGKEGGGVSTGFKDTKVESSVREDAVALLDNVAVGATTIDAAYTKLRKLYSPSEVSDQALKELLGITPPPTTSQGTAQTVTPPNKSTFTADPGSSFPVPVQQFMSSIENLLFK